MEIKQASIHGLEQAMNLMENHTVEPEKLSRIIVVWVEMCLPRQIWNELKALCSCTTISLEDELEYLKKKAYQITDFEPEWEQVDEKILDEMNLLLEKAHSGPTLRKKALRQLDILLPGSILQKKLLVIDYESLHTLYLKKRKNQEVIWYRLCSWMEDLPCSQLILRADLKEQLEKARKEIESLEKALEKSQSDYHFLHENYTRLLKIKQELEYALYVG